MPQTLRRKPGGASAQVVVAAPDLLVPHPPRPLVRRPRLFDVLDQGREGPLTLVSAPPGAGKTALLSSWLAERRPDALAWLSLRPGQTAPAFWAELLEALKLATGARSALGQLSVPRGPAPPRFVAQLLNGFADLDAPLTVVIDDFHELRGTRVSDGIDALLHAAPEQLRLVISTRHDPALPLHILRASGELTELRARDLAFTPEEAEELLTALGLELEPAVFSLLLQRTEGWAAGLRLFSLSLSERGREDQVVALSLDDRPAVDYLAAEVMAGQPEDVRRFLAATAIVDRLTPELADALLEGTEGAQMLERLVAANLFTERVETLPASYRYHPLFAELLRAELRRTRRDELPVLHRRAALWFFEQGDALEAVRHALAARDLRLLTMCLVDTWFELFARGGAGSGIELVGEMTAELRAVAATMHLANGRRRRGERLLEEAERAWPAEAEPAAEAVRLFARLQSRSLDGAFGEAAVLAEKLRTIAVSEPLPGKSARVMEAIALSHLGTAELALGRLDEARPRFDEVFELSRDEVPYAALAGTGGLAWIELSQGRLRRAARLASGAVDSAEAQGLETCSQAVFAYLTLALAELEWDDLSSVEKRAKQLAAIGRAADDRFARAWSGLVNGALGLVWGGKAAEVALQQVRGVRAEAGSVDSPGLRRFGTTLEARLLAALGEREAAARLVDDAPDPLLTTKARLLLGDGRGEEAAVVLAQAPASVEGAVLLVLAHRALGDEAAVDTALEHALALAEPENVRRPFLDAGHALREPLARHIRHSPAQRWFASELLGELEGKRGNGSAPTELLDPLSARELEVLHYLPTMMSNADIAVELFVSVNTVKTHVKSIYRKLDAKRRQDAVRRARQLHLL